MAHKDGSYFPALEQDNQIMLCLFWAGRDVYDSVFVKSKPCMAHLSVIIGEAFGLSECLNLYRIMPQSRKDFTESQMSYQFCLSPLSCA